MAPARAIIVLLTLQNLLYKAHAFNVLYIPLGERFTTRFAFLNLAAVTPYTVLTPPMDIISQLRDPAPLPQLDAWMDANMPLADAAVISAELFLYGGLITSRCSNDSTEAISARLNKLVQYAQNYPIRIYLGTTVLRIPGYNENPPMEEPTYWAQYGLDLYTYSFYLDKFNHTHDPADLQTAEQAEAQVPPAIVQDFLWRRQRNHNIPVRLLELQANSTAAGEPLFQSIYVTQDDNAEYGFNIQEATELKQLVARFSLQNYVRVYPGADEVGLSMLSRMTVDAVGEAFALELGLPVPRDPVELTSLAAPKLNLVFRDPTNTSLYRIPNYEGQPMIFTLMDQIAAAGGVAVPNNWTTGNIGSDARTAALRSSRPAVTLLVNDFSEVVQIEAPNQPTAGRSIADYSMFTPFVCGGGNATASVVSFVDNRYSNGADIIFVQYVTSLASNPSCASPNSSNFPAGLSMDRFAYAGWNTDGNTLGDAISNAIILHFFATFGSYGGVAEQLDRTAAVRRANARSDSRSTPLPVPARSLQASCSASCANTYRILLRLVEDNNYQASLRQSLVAYVSQVDGENVDTLYMDLAFYQRYAYKVLASRATEYASAFSLNWTLASVGYPWNRTFEISLWATGT